MFINVKIEVIGGRQLLTRESVMCIRGYAGDTYMYYIPYYIYLYYQ
jgi:hypothetical protein